MTNQPQVGLRLNGLYSEKSNPLTIDLFLEHVVSARMVFGGFSLPTQDGLLMLLHQGTKSYEIWFGEDAPVEVMREALLNAVGRR